MTNPEAQDKLAVEVEEAITKYKIDFLAPVFNGVEEPWREWLTNPNGYYRWLMAAVKVWKPKHILELGTYHGVSALAMYASDPNVLVTTIELEEQKEHFMILPSLLNKGSRLRVIFGDDLLETTKAQVHTKTPIDMFFIDTIHTRDQAEKEWDMYKDLLADRCLVVFDDFSGSVEFGGDLGTYQRKDVSKFHGGTGFSFFIYEKT